MKQFTPAEVVEILKEYPGSMYELSALVGVTQVSLLAFKRGERLPSRRTATAIADALMLVEYYDNCDALMATGKTIPNFWSWHKKKTYTYTKKSNDLAIDESTTLSTAANEQDIYLQLFLPLKNELAAAHAMILAMRETNKLLEDEVIRLKARS